MKTYSGKILIEQINIRELAVNNQNEQLKKLWDIYKSSEIPVIVYCPTMYKNKWKKLGLTNIYLTVDSKSKFIINHMRCFSA